MQQLVRDLSVAGAVLAGWHLIVLVALLALGTRSRIRGGSPVQRTVPGIAVVLMVNAIILYLLVIGLALPSGLSLKVDFRTPEDLHSSGLIWSDVTL